MQFSGCIILLVSSLTVYGGILHSPPHTIISHFEYVNGEAPTLLWVNDFSILIRKQFARVRQYSPSSPSLWAVHAVWSTRRRCRMNTQTIWEIACQLIRMQTLYHAGTMKPVSQLKGAIQEAGKNSVSARRWHSMKYMMYISNRVSLSHSLYLSNCKVLSAIAQILKWFYMMFKNIVLLFLCFVL